VRVAANGRTVKEAHFADGAHAVRYGNGGYVERPAGPGSVTRTFVAGGHVLYARTYRSITWQHYGRVWSYEHVVPAYAFAPAYFGWAYRPWGVRVVYPWGWQAQPWYGVYGAYFTPYPAYVSLDQWLTDEIVAENLQASYEMSLPPSAAPGAPPPTPPPAPAGPGTPASPANPSAQSDQAPPPPMPTDVKDELDAQIKAQLQEQTNAAQAAPDGPPALRPGHVLFRVVAPLDVPSGTANQLCSLAPNDYLRRSGDMSPDGTVPVVVRLSAAGDCRAGTATQISLATLMGMENEQEAQVLNAMNQASQNMGPNGLPRAPGASPVVIPAGQTSQDPQALATLSSL
jgi:hypothetical protein